MNLRTRLLSALLAGSITLSLPGTALAAEGQAPADDGVRGSIRATLRLDYAQNLQTLKARQVTVTLRRDQTVLGTAALAGEAAPSGAVSLTVTPRNSDGGELGGGQWPGYFDVTAAGLPRGTYSLDFTGLGYVSYSQEVILDDYAQQVVLGTGDATFALGDVDGSGAVDEADRTALSAALGAGDADGLERYDLNGDGKIDIIDLAYVGRQIHAVGAAEVYDTVLLAPPVQTAEIEETLTVQGDVADLFQDNGRSVTLSGGEAGRLEIPLPLSDALEVEAIEIASPDGSGAVRKGVAVVEDEAGEKTEYPFDQTLPENVHALGRAPGGSVVTIHLGNRVAVKKVTVSVTLEEGGDYAVVDSIRFLKDIVPENPVAPNSEVKSITAVEGSEQVTLKWGELPNVTGYKVSYGLKSGGERKELHVDVPTAVVKGLKNLEPYTFTVTPTSEGWEGIESQSVEATPQPASRPDAPDMVTIQEQDGALGVSWKKSKNATYYEVYYAEGAGAAAGDYRQAGGALTELRTTLTGLTNGATYSVYVVAGNAIGKSGPSRVYEGAPTAVKYEAPKGLPGQLTPIGRDRVECIALADPGNVSRSKSTENFTTDYLMDGNYQTNWTSQSWGDGNYARSKQIVYTFKTPVDLSYVVYVPRLDGYQNCMRLYGVTVWREGDDLNGPGTPLVTMNGRDKTPINGRMGSAQDGYFDVFPFPATTGIQQIAVNVEQTGYGAVGLAEVLFYEYDPAQDLDKQIDALFADAAHTDLAADVTAERVAELTAALQGHEGYYFYPNTMKDELKLAAELLTGESTGVVLRGVESRSSAADGAKYGQGGSDLQSLGAAAKAGQEITIYAQGIPQGEIVSVSATQFYAEASTWQATLGVLQNGRNVFTVPKIGSQSTPRGGSLYFTYSGEHGAGITLHVRRASDVPVLALDGWYDMAEAERQAVIAAYVAELSAYAKTIPSKGRETNCLNVTELSLPTVLLSIPATAVWDQTGKTDAERVETLSQTVLAWEQLMHIAKTTQGIDNTYEHNDMTSRQNIRYMQMFAGAFMYAAGSHVGVGYGSCGGLVCGKPVDGETAAAGKNRLFGWGVAHEIGHNMDKLGKAECTNNLYSLMAQTFDGADNTLPSRLEGGKYEAIFTKTAQGWPGASNDVFVQLGLYWQLHLAYDGGGADALDFYNRFFKTWKAGEAFSGAETYDDKVALVAAHTAGTDLTAFFTRWGMRLSDGAKATLRTYAPEPRALWYLDDGSRRDRLSGVAPGAGDVTAAAEKTGDTEVTLTLAADLTAGNLQGYEVRRNGTPIAFTAEDTYVDTIGSANHMSFTYTVQAYDTLGNPIGDAVEAGEVRVAYDKTVDPDTYTLTRDGTTVTVAMKEGAAPVSGVKLTGAVPAEGAFTVTVTAGEETVTAKAGDYADNQAVDDLSSYLAYFNKPGTEASDSRIWTYDVETLVMTDVPQDASLALVSYAGDDVAFTPGGAVGRLSEAYVYGDGADDVIPAGTLVVTGTYRGDPVYTTLRVKGDFVSTAVGEDGEQTSASTQRYLNGYALFFAEIPEDQQVSDISDGIFLFVPDVQAEAQLQGAASHCEASNLLPARIRVELSRTDDPADPSSQRTTATTAWIASPGGEDLPTIVLEGNEA